MQTFGNSDIYAYWLYISAYILCICVYQCQRLFLFAFQSSDVVHAQRHANVRMRTKGIPPPWDVTVKYLGIELRSVLWFLVCPQKYFGIAKGTGKTNINPWLLLINGLYAFYEWPLPLRGVIYSKNIQLLR